MATKYLAPKDARSVSIIGNGAQSEFQAIAFKSPLGVNELRLYDIEPMATEGCTKNLEHLGFGQEGKDKWWIELLDLTPDGVVPNRAAAKQRSS